MTSPHPTPTKKIFFEKFLLLARVCMCVCLLGLAVKCPSVVSGQKLRVTTLKGVGE